MIQFIKESLKGFQKFNRKQWLTILVFAIADFCSAICVSLQAPFYPKEAEKKGGKNFFKMWRKQKFSRFLEKNFPRNYIFLSNYVANSNFAINFTKQKISILAEKMCFFDFLISATATEYGLVFGIFELTVFIVSPIIGKNLSKYGAKRVFNIGILTTGTCCILFGLLDKINNGKVFIINHKFVSLNHI